jgi:hypothetical protein
MDLVLGWVAFAGAVLIVCIARTVLIGWGRWGRGTATAAAIGAPLVLAATASALAVASDGASTHGSGALTELALPVFFLIALVIGALGTTLSKLVRGEFSMPRD